MTRLQPRRCLFRFSQTFRGRIFFLFLACMSSLPRRLGKVKIGKLSSHWLTMSPLPHTSPYPFYLCSLKSSTIPSSCHTSVQRVTVNCSKVLQRVCTEETDVTFGKIVSTATTYFRTQLYSFTRRDGLEAESANKHEGSVTHRSFWNTYCIAITVYKLLSNTEIGILENSSAALTAAGLARLYLT